VTIISKYISSFQADRTQYQNLICIKKGVFLQYHRNEPLIYSVQNDNKVRIWQNEFPVVAHSRLAAMQFKQR
jgi:hypothetical protein